MTWGGFWSCASVSESRGNWLGGFFFFFSLCSFCHPSHVAYFSFLPLSSVLLASIEFWRTKKKLFLWRKFWQSGFFWFIIYIMIMFWTFHKMYIQNGFPLNHSPSGDPVWLIFLAHAWKKHGNTMEVWHRKMGLKNHGNIMEVIYNGKTKEISWKCCITKKGRISF